MNQATTQEQDCPEIRQSTITVADEKALLRRLRRKAARHADAGRVREALDCQRQVTDLAPNDPHEFMQLGFLHRQADQLDDATEAFERALTLAPSDPIPHEALAEVYLDTARYDDAVREGKAVLKLVPGSLPARQILSSAYFQTGQTDKALDVSREIVQLAPLDSISHYKNGVLLQQRENWRLALQEFMISARIAPEDSIERGEAESAIEALDRQQIGLVMALAADDWLFKIRLARDAAEATQERGYFLSGEAASYVQHLAAAHSDDGDLFGPSLLSRPMLYN